MTDTVERSRNTEIDGDVVEDENGDEIYNRRIAESAIRHITRVFTDNK